MCGPAFGRRIGLADSPGTAVNRGTLPADEEFYMGTTVLPNGKELSTVAWAPIGCNNIGTDPDDNITRLSDCSLVAGANYSVFERNGDPGFGAGTIQRDFTAMRPPVKIPVSMNATKWM